MDLASEGLIVRFPGRGSFVGSPKYTTRLNRLSSYFQEMLARGHQPSSRVISQYTSSASAELASALDLEEGEEVMVLERLRFADEMPMTIHRAHVPCRLFPELVTAENLGNKSLFAIYRATGHAPATAHDRIEIRLAGQTQSRLLAVPTGFPLWYVQRVTRDEAGVAIEYLESHTRSDRYVYELDLSC
jgi:GntR family transcriptional regulator